MDHAHLNYGAGYVTEYPAAQYLAEGASTASSPSPVMWPPAEGFAVPPEQYAYEGYANVPFMLPPQYSPPADLPVVEFTDLTAPYDEDRRRRQPQQAKDKQAMSSMHLRRRAQNRASQRAFRERKEKHAQELQRQLNELQDKHKALEEAFDELGANNKKLQTELQQLRSRISAVHASQAQLERSSQPDASALSFEPGDDHHATDHAAALARSHRGHR